MPPPHNNYIPPVVLALHHFTKTHLVHLHAATMQQLQQTGKEWWHHCRRLYYKLTEAFAFSTLTTLVGQQEGHPACKNEWWGAGVVICLERGADLHAAQLIPLPLTVSCFSKIQIGFTFLVLAYPGSPGQRAVKRVCVCVCVTEATSLELADEFCYFW